MGNLSSTAFKAKNKYVIYLSSSFTGSNLICLFKVANLMFFSNLNMLKYLTGFKKVDWDLIR